MKTTLLFLFIFLSVSLFSQNELYYFNNGLNHYEAGEFQEAINDYTSFIKINPNDAYAYFNRRLAYVELGKFQEAINDFTRAIKINP